MGSKESSDTVEEQQKEAEEESERLDNPTERRDELEKAEGSEEGGFAPNEDADEEPFKENEEDPGTKEENT